MKNLKVIVLLALSANSIPALAYIDPASGSAVMSAIIGFIVASAIVVKTYWYKLKSFFGGGKKEEKPEESEQP